MSILDEQCKQIREFDKNSRYLHYEEQLVKERELADHTIGYLKPIHGWK